MLFKVNGSFLLIAIASFAASVVAKQSDTQLVAPDTQNATTTDHTIESATDGVSGATDVGQVMNGTGVPGSLLGSSGTNKPDALTHANSSTTSTLSDASGETEDTDSLGLSNDNVNGLSTDQSKPESTDKSSSDKSASDSKKGKDGDKSSATSTHVSLALISALFCAFVAANLS